MAIPDGRSWFYEKESLSPPLVRTLPFPLEFEAEINESVALMVRNGSTEWEGGPSQRVPMADSGHLLQGTKGDEGENELRFFVACQKSFIYS